MKIEKIIETKLTINNPFSVFSSEDGLLTELRSRFNGLCRDKCKILNVTEIIEKSYCVVEDNWGDSSFAVNLKFKVEATQYYTGEVITDPKIIRKTNDLIIANNEDAKISMKASDLPVTEGMMLPMRVHAACYQLFRENIAVNSIPYIPSKTFYFADKDSSPVARPVGFKVDISTINIPEFLKLSEGTEKKINNVMQVLSEYKKNNPNGYDAIKDLLYPFATPPERDPKIYQPINIMQLYADIKAGKPPTGITGYLVRDNSIPLDSDKIYLISKDNRDFIPNSANTTEISILYSMELFASDLDLLKRFYETYSSEENFLKHKLLWKMYRKLKQ